MSGDLVERLRQQAHNRTANFGADAYKATPEWQAATLIEAQAAEIQRLKLEHQYACQEIGVAVAERDEWKTRAEIAERALAEAVDVMRPFAKAGELFGPRPADGYDQCIYNPAAGDEFGLSGDHLRAARNFVKEHGK